MASLVSKFHISDSSLPLKNSPWLLVIKRLEPETIKQLYRAQALCI